MDSPLHHHRLSETFGDTSNAASAATDNFSNDPLGDPPAQDFATPTADQYLVLTAAPFVSATSASQAVTNLGTSVPSSSPFVIDYVIGTNLAALNNDGSGADQATYNGYVGAIKTAISYYESIITTPITITINFDWGYLDTTPSEIPVTGGLAESRTSYASVSYTQLYQAYKAIANKSAVQTAAFNTLTANDPTNGGTFLIDPAQAAALGLTSLFRNVTTDGYVGLNTSLPGSDSYNWTQTNIAFDQYDAVGALEHEISEDMGRVDFGGQGSDYSLLDMFRYTAADGQSGDAPGAQAGARDQPFVTGYSANAYSYFSYNGSTITNQYDIPANTNPPSGADIADWADTVPNDSYGYAFNGQAGLVTSTDQEELQVLGYDVTCFLAGTRVTTDRGEVAVEDLAIGDRVVTHAGATRPIRWIGTRSFFGRFVARNPGVQPVLFRAGSLADGVPRRDLYVSPRHAMFLDGMLIEAANLVNGVTISRAGPMRRVDYFHIELESHDVILAEAAASETFVDDDSRNMFHNAAEYAARYPEAAAVAALYCAPRVADGFALEAVRQRLGERAGVRFPPREIPLRGHVDRVGTRLIEGWAQNPANPEAPVCLDIVLDGAVLARTLANRSRPDLLRARLGSGRHAFSIRLTRSLSAEERRAVEVCRSSDRATLPRAGALGVAA